MKLELEGEWLEIQEICRRIGGSGGEKTTSAFDDELALMIAKDGIITAIKHHRAKTGSSLKDAKDYVEALKSRLNL